jgi:hypothetical protein
LFYICAGAVVSAFVLLTIRSVQGAASSYSARSSVRAVTPESARLAMIHIGAVCARQILGDTDDEQI